MKYKIDSYHGGYAIYVKKHWYNKWKLENPNQYWSSYQDLLEYLGKDLNKRYNSVEIVKDSDNKIIFKVE